MAKTKEQGAAQIDKSHESVAAAISNRDEWQHGSPARLLPTTPFLDNAPQLVRSWIDHLPIWLEVRSPLALPDSSLAKLDAGERDAITLATELHADQIIGRNLRWKRRDLSIQRLPFLPVFSPLSPGDALPLSDQDGGGSRDGTHI
jgi:hypothetical protein